MKADFGPHMMPQDVLRLTISEIAFYVRPVAERTPSGGRAMSDVEIHQYCEWYTHLTPKQKLQAAREGRLL